MKSAPCIKLKEWTLADDSYWPRQIAQGSDALKENAAVIPLAPLLDKIRCIAYLPNRVGFLPHMVDIPIEEFNSLSDWTGG